MKVFRRALSIRLACLAMSVLLVGGVLSMLFSTFPPASRATDFLLILAAALGIMYAAIAPTVAVWCSRVETDIAGIRVYDWRGRCTFNALWVWVQRYQRMADLRWRIEAGKAEAWLPDVEDKDGLQVEILRHLPQAALEHASRPPNWPTKFTNPISAKARRRSDIDSLAYGPFLLIILVYVVNSMNGSFWNLGYVIAAAAFAALANVLCVRFFRALKRLRAKVEVDERHIRYDDGEGLVEIPWDEVRFIVGPGLDGTESNLLLMTQDRSLTIERGFPAFGQIAALAVAQAPENATIFP